ncbi:MAG: hypothetical protein AAGF23_01220 [Acidobacteriota bacterium]
MMETFRRFKDLFAYVVASLLGLLGLLIAVVTVNVGDGGAATAAISVGLGVLPMAVAFWLYRSVWRSALRRRRELAERRVLVLAGRTGGWLTPLQVARATDLTLEEAKVLLNRLNIEGHCQIELAADGVVSYRFAS